MLLNLPTELVVEILAYLSKTDIENCNLTCRHLNNVISQSVILQYHIALLEATADDNPCSQLPLAEKLEELRNGERAWSTLNPIFKITIPVKHRPSGIYDLTGGIYLLGNHNRRDLHYVRLPRHSTEEPQWSTIHVDHMIVDLGLCVYEHDLIAVVTASPNFAQYDLEIVLFEFSTSKPHPQAQKHVIPVLTSPSGKPAIGIEIVGDNLVLILFFHNNFVQKPDDRVYIFDWKTGVVKTSFSAPYGTYSSVIFLDEEMILLPNTVTNALDVYRIPAKPTVEIKPVMSFALPRLAENRKMASISCRAEPNPIASSSSMRKMKAKRPGNEDDMFPKRPYLANVEHAICLFSLRVLDGVLHSMHSYTFVVMRRALTDALQAIEESGSMPSLSSPKQEGVDRFPDQSTPTLPWAEWGPPVTRWFNADSIPTRWITTTAGQRCVLIAESAADTGFPYVVLNFNPESVPRMRKQLKAARDREKARERRARQQARERAVEEAAEWARTTMAQMDDDDDDDEDDDQDMDKGDYENDLWHAYEQDAEGNTENQTVYRPENAEETNPDQDVRHEVNYRMSSVGEEGDLPGPVHAGPSIPRERGDLGGDPAPGSSSARPQDDGSDHSPEHSALDQQPIDTDFPQINSDRDADTSEIEDENAVLDQVQMEIADSASENGGDIIPDEDGESLDDLEETAARRIWCVTSAELAEPAECFAERVEGRLPYVACASPQNHMFNGVLLDEERVIGIKTDTSDRITHIEVHYYG